MSDVTAPSPRLASAKNNDNQPDSKTYARCWWVVQLARLYQRRLPRVLGKRQTERLDEAPVVLSLNREAAAKSDAPPALAESTSETPGESTNAPSSEEYTRGYLLVGIGGSRVRALCDSGASRTALGRIGLQIATECGKTITPHKGRGARLADGKSVPILGHVELPFDVAGVRRYIDAIIVDELDADYLLGADFMRKFNAVLRPREATRSIEDGMERVPLQLSTLDEDGARTIHLDSVGLADADEIQRELIQALL